MNDNEKTKAELIHELTLMRKKILALEQAQAEHKCIEAASPMSEISFRAIFEQSPFAIEIYSPDGTIQQVNRAAEKLWGITYEDIVGYNILQDLQLINNGLMPYLERAFAGEATVISPLMYDPALTGYLGRSRWVETFIYPVKDKNRKIFQVITMQEDITERKLAEQALQKTYDELELRVAERTAELSQANEILREQLFELKRADEQREILQQILENIPLMIDYFDDSGNILLINKEWENFFGWTMERLKREGTGAFLSAIVPDAEKRKKIIGHMLLSPPGWHDLKIRLADGRVLETCWVIIKLSNGRTIGIGQDISERKRAEDDLQKSEASLRAIIEGVTDCIYMKDLDGRYLLINSATAYAMDTTIPGVIGRNDAMLFDAVTAFHVMAGDQHVFNTGQTQTSDDFIMVAGDQRIFHTTKVPHRDKEGNIIGVIGISRDITDRRRAQEALAAEKERLAVTLRSIGDGVITTDTEGKVVLINKVAEMMTGVTQEDAAGKPLARIFHIINEKTRKTCRNLVDKVLKTGSTVERTNHIVLIAKNGIERIIADSAATIRDKESKVIGVVLVFRDITEKRKIEEKLLHARAARAAAKLAEAEMEKTNVQLQALSAHVLKAQEEERIRLARELHDELGQALTSIKLALELAITSLPHGDINKTSRVLSDLCAYVETTGKDVQRVARDLRPSVLDDFGLAAALESYSDAYSKRTGIKVSLSLDHLSRPLSKEAETVLYRIVQEALTNAAKHAGAKNISIDLTERMSDIILTVLDDGKGCGPELASHQKSGFGLLGMTERARIIGARLSITSKPREGFCLQIHLPTKRVKL